MSQTKTFLVVVLAFFSVCVGASLMQYVVAKPALIDVDQVFLSAEPTCRRLIAKHGHSATSQVAKEIYQDALKLSFDGEWSKAREASECAAWLEHGTKKWALEAKDLIN